MSLRDAKRELLWWGQARAHAARLRSMEILGGSGLSFSPNGYVELVPVQVAGAGRGHVTVRAEVSAVNVGTERAQYLRLPNTSRGDGTPPAGSMSGVVIRVGRGVDGLEPGQRVAVMSARHASVETAPSEQVVPIPDEVSFADASLVAHSVIALQGLRLAEPGPAERFGVVGSGIIGALTLRLAAAARATPAAVVATSRAKEQAARGGGAESFLVVGQDDEAIDELGLPLVFEVTGDPDALDVAVRMAAPGGRVVLLGSSRGVSRAVPIAQIRTKGLTLIGAHVDTVRNDGPEAARREAARFLDLVAHGAVRLGDLVSRTIDPRDAPKLYRDMVADRSIIGAALDWSLLADRQRVRPHGAYRLPDLTGRGMEFDGPVRHLPRSAEIRSIATADPFAGASGHLRIGMLGCGDIAVHNAAGIAEAPNARLVACFDPDERLALEIAERQGARTVLSAEALVEDDEVDAVLISVPHHLHESLTLLALAAGKHVVVEKPLSANLPSAHRMVVAADDAGLRLSTCFPQRYESPVPFARDLVRRGALGELGGSTVKVLLDKSPDYWLGGFSGRAHSTWRSSREHAGGGVLIMNVCHYIDVVRHLAEVEVESVSAQMNAVDDDLEVEDSIAVALKYRNGAIGSITASSAVRGTTFSEVQLWGRDGHLVLEPNGRYYSLRPLDDARTARWHQLERGASRSSRAVYFSRFATAIDRGEEPDVTANDGLCVQAVLEAAYRSSGEGAPVGPEELIAELSA